VFFQSDLSKGLDCWQASGGCAVRDFLLEMDGQDNRTLTIPYQPSTRNYDVEFQLQVVSVPEDGGYFRLHAMPTPTASGYVAQVFHLLTPTPHLNGDHPTATRPSAHRVDGAQFSAPDRLRATRYDVDLSRRGA
jgi:hypothetical protein